MAGRSYRCSDLRFLRVTSGSSGSDWGLPEVSRDALAAIHPPLIVTNASPDGSSEDSEMPNGLDALLEYCRDNQRVCPHGMQWTVLWEMLPGRERRGAGWEPSAPLILAAWWETSDEQKRQRLEL